MSNLPRMDFAARITRHPLAADPDRARHVLSLFPALDPALAALIGSEADAVTVVDGAGASLGRLSFEDIRSALAEPSEREA